MALAIGIFAVVGILLKRRADRKRDGIAAKAPVPPLWGPHQARAHPVYSDGTFDREKVRNPKEDEWQQQLGQLVEPILPYADENDIIWLVPHDALHYLPLHALKVEGRYLIERNPVCYTPSGPANK